MYAVSEIPLYQTTNFQFTGQLLTLYLKLRLLSLRLEILLHPSPRNLHNLRILNSRRHANRRIKPSRHRMLHQLPQHPSQRLPAPRLGDHPPALDYPAQRGDGANLLTDERVDLAEEFGWHVGRQGVLAGARCDEGEGEVALELVWDADYACFGDGRVGEDDLFDLAWGLLDGGNGEVWWECDVGGLPVLNRWAATLMISSDRDMMCK